MKKSNDFKPLIKFIKEDKFKLIIASIIILLAGATGIFTGYLNGKAVDSITKLNFISAIKFLLIYFLIMMFEMLFSFYAKANLHKIESKMARKIGFNSYKKILDLPAVAFEEKSSGEIINRVTNDADTLSFTLGRLLNVVSSFVSSFIILFYIFYNSWIIGFEIIIFLIILYFVLKVFNPKLKQIHKERKEYQDKFTSVVNESVRGIREIRTLGIKNSLITDITDVIKELYKKSIREIDIQKVFNIFTNILKLILEVGVFISCTVLLYYEKIDLVFFIAMTYYIYRYMWLIENINDFTQTYQRVIVSLGRINDILENRLYEDMKYGNITLDNIKGIIEFKNVSFSYPNEKNTLNDFSAVFMPNKKIAIVGASGQGKSTLFNLITRIFDAQEGEILLDGINIKDLSEQTLRNSISIIRQEPFIFNRTIKENFTLIDSKVKLKDIRKYTNMAYLDDYIMSLPKKYNTILGEGGVNLSGGQKQRLSIARTLSKKSKIVLFDEATSALDNNSQEYIKKAIDDMVSDHTVIIVAHRLSTIIDADIIYVVDSGKIVAKNTHEKLLKTSKVYRKLYKKDSLNSNI